MPGPVAGPHLWINPTGPVAPEWITYEHGSPMMALFPSRPAPLRVSMVQNSFGLLASSPVPLERNPPPLPRIITAPMRGAWKSPRVSMRQIKISIIIPAYNEETSIIEVLESVRAQRLEGVELEVIVIDDCSKDRTRELLTGRPDLYTHFLHRAKNGGKGAAVLEGLRMASGDYVLFQDADLEYDPADYTKLIMPLQRFDADIVMGSRLMAPPFTRVAYYWHRLGNRFITFLFNIMNNTTFSDIYSCYLCYRRELVPPERLKSLGWEQQAEILSLAVANGAKFYEVPISYQGRTYKEGKKIRAYHIISVLVMIVRGRLFR